jgi:hypothetical protein
MELAEALDAAIAVRDTCQWLPSATHLDPAIPRDAHIITDYHRKIEAKRAEEKPVAERLGKAYRSAQEVLTGEDWSEDEEALIGSNLETFRVILFDVDEDAMGPTQRRLAERDRELGRLASRFRLKAERLLRAARQEAAKMRATKPMATPEAQAGDTRRTVLFENNFEKVCILTPTGRRGIKADLRPSPLTILLKKLFTEWEKDPETRLEWTGAFQKEIGYGKQVDPGKDSRPSRRWRDPNKKTPSRTKILNKIIEDTRDDVSGPWKVRLEPRYRYKIN